MKRSPSVRILHLDKLATAVMAIVILPSLASPARAEIVYHKLNIVVNEGDYNLDLNGVTYFTITARTFVECQIGQNSGHLSETPAPGNGAIVGPLNAGDEIGPGQVFFQTENVLVYFHRSGYPCLVTWGGTWCSPGGTGCNPITAYLGLKAEVGGETHYGWLLLSIPRNSASAALLGVAYETTPGMAIQAGQTH